MKGLLLVNTGSPETNKINSVRAFIQAILMDPLVLPIRFFWRWILVKLFITPFRQFSSTRKYKMIWYRGEVASPLHHNTNKLAKELKASKNIKVEVGMRYLNPSIKDALNRLQSDPDVDEITIFPLFPLYSISSYQTIINEIQRNCKEQNITKPLKLIEPYYLNPFFIESLTNSLKPNINKYCSKVIFNFHSLPISEVEECHSKGRHFDYVYQAKEIIKLVRQKINIPANQIRLCFSSNFGENWIGPKLKNEVVKMAETGIEDIIVISPGFACDNLETLYDIGVEARKAFLSNGGKMFMYIPCLNYDKEWAKSIIEIMESEVNFFDSKYYFEKK